MIFAIRRMIILQEGELSDRLSLHDSLTVLIIILRIKRLLKILPTAGLASASDQKPRLNGRIHPHAHAQQIKVSRHLKHGMHHAAMHFHALHAGDVGIIKQNGR